MDFTEELAKRMEQTFVTLNLGGLFVGDNGFTGVTISGLGILQSFY